MPRRLPYSPEVKQAAVQRLLAPDAPPVIELSRELQISEPTLYAWRKEALTMAKRRAEEGQGRQVEPETVESLRQRVRALEAELARKNGQIADLAMLVLRQQGLVPNER